MSGAVRAGEPRWVVYQRERFPILAHGALIAAFSSGAVCYSAQLRATRDGTPFSVQASSLVVAFVSCLLFFFELRVSDEHKDFEDDLRWRPYRPVPRGLVTLRELTWVAMAGALVQLGLALWLEPRLVAPLAAVWGFMALMTREFGVREWLRRHPITVLWSHMLILPLIDLYATACDWMPSGAGRVVGEGLAWFLVASFFNGIVVEIGRKIRAPADEEIGVETYSALWGIRRATLAWLGAMACTLLFATLAARAVGAAWIVAGLLGAIGLAAVVTSRRLATAPVAGAGKRAELLSGLWTIAMYLGVGVLPLLVRR
jgi:4-hydroxybenzoate polyprenyltransferase